MKIRIASSIALAAGLMLGATGCGMIAPQATTESYAPSDGIDVNVGDVKLRNVMLIADETGENFNVVFSAVNTTGAPVDLSISFAGKGSQRASAEFTVPTGSTAFGDPDGSETPVLVTVDGLVPGATADAYFQVSGASEVQYDVPALDAELDEYSAYVLPAGFGAEDETDADEADAEGENGSGSESGSTGASADESSTEEQPAAE